MYNIIGLLLLALDIYALYLILTSSEEAGKKILWVVLVLILPLIGPLLYFTIGRGSTAA